MAYQTQAHVSGWPLSQPVRPHYSDGASATHFPDLASPRDLSLELFTEDSPSGLTPLSQKYTALLPFFSEFVCHSLPRYEIQVS